MLSISHGFLQLDGEADLQLSHFLSETILLDELSASDLSPEFRGELLGEKRVGEINVFGE